MKSSLQLLGFLVFSMFAAGAAQADIISCSSSGYKYNSCSTNGYVTRVILRQQISNSACVYGQSWGFDSQSIWVDKGCRATFETFGNNGYPPPGNGYNPPPDYGYPPPGYGHNPGYPPAPPLDQQEQIQCGSYGYSLNYCYPAAAGRIVYVRLLRQLSRSACISGSTYGVAGDSIWVNNGCQGVFQVVSRQYNDSLSSY